MTRVFADTSFYVALLSPRDERHSQAIAVSIASKPPILTTEFVVVELADFFSRVADRTTFINFVNYIRSHPNTSIVPVSSDFVEKGFELFSHRLDKEWSLTDCISLVAMQEQGVTDALTTDGHFAQAGFNMLL